MVLRRSSLDWKGATMRERVKLDLPVQRSLLGRLCETWTLIPHNW